WDRNETLILWIEGEIFRPRGRLLLVIERSAVSHRTAMADFLARRNLLHRAKGRGSLRIEARHDRRGLVGLAFLKVGDARVLRLDGFLHLLHLGLELLELLRRLRICAQGREE